MTGQTRSAASLVLALTLALRPRCPGSDAIPPFPPGLRTHQLSDLYGLYSSLPHDTPSAETLTFNNDPCPPLLTGVQISWLFPPGVLAIVLGLQASTHRTQSLHPVVFSRPYIFYIFYPSVPLYFYYLPLSSLFSLILRFLLLPLHIVLPPFPLSTPLSSRSNRSTLHCTLPL